MSFAYCSAPLASIQEVDFFGLNFCCCLSLLILIIIIFLLLCPIGQYSRGKLVFVQPLGPARMSSYS